MREARGDTHNFGRRVERRGNRIRKPRTLVWERLLLSASSPLRRALDELARAEGLPPFDFLPDLQFYTQENEVDAIQLAPIDRVSPEEKERLAVIGGSALALFAWLGIGDLHWENLALGRDLRTRGIVFTPLDVEIILEDFALPAETRLIPEADADIGEVYRHAAGLRRLLPFLGKPLTAPLLVAMASAYYATLEAFECGADQLAAAFAAEPELASAPLRVCLRGTDEYVLADERPPFPPLLDAEQEQLARGDIPYFFRLYGAPGIRFYGDAELRIIKRLPSARGRGGDVLDVPTLAPLLSVAKGLRSPSQSRTKLRELGLLTLLGAFDHPGLRGSRERGDVTINFDEEAFEVTMASGEVGCPRDLREVVGSMYLTCSCGEVREVLVPPVTTCR